MNSFSNDGQTLLQSSMVEVNLPKWPLPESYSPAMTLVVEFPSVFEPFS
jgi:hypothetical protein